MIRNSRATKQKKKRLNIECARIRTIPTKKKFHFNYRENKEKAHTVMSSQEE